ncbi:MAG: hypothetical protein CVU39_08030 [Chloroflexi bacterium HGW-Chloroflexi-10]|nr:MAG: hypothetical protein CVU39_08030 [Chloroflexi bacterium HGW-Chloroflexi-10]
MYRLGIHLSYWQENWSDDLYPLISRAFRAGFNIAEFPLLAPAALDYPNLRSVLDSYGMTASCGTGLNQNTDITSPVAEIRKAGLKHLQECLLGAAKLGSPVLGGLTYAPWGVFPEDNWGLHRKQCINSLQEVGKMAGDFGVSVCLEVVNRFEGYLLNTVDQGLALLAEIDNPNLKLHLDTFHMNIEEDDIAKAIQKTGNQLGHLHVVENNRKSPGQGHIPWKEVSQSLKKINYDGFIVAEIFVNPAGEVGKGLFIWRSLADDLDENAFQTCQFLKKEFADV